VIPVHAFNSPFIPNEIIRMVAQNTPLIPLAGRQQGSSFRLVVFSMSISYWAFDRDKEKRMPKHAIESTQDRVQIEACCKSYQMKNHTASIRPLRSGWGLLEFFP